jgi:putative peptidoglycan lipid II flippase
MALPVLAASWLAPVNLIVGGKALLAFGGEYDYGAFNFANNVYTIASGVFVLSVANVVCPQLSKQAAAGDGSAFKRTLRSTLDTSVFFLLPMALGLAAVSKPLVRLMFESGLFDAGAVDATSGALEYFSLGIVGYGLQIIASRACYVLKDGKNPAYSSVAAIVLNAALCFVFVRLTGAEGAVKVSASGGAAMASAVSITVAAGWLLLKLNRGGHLLPSKGSGYFKMFLLAVGMYLAVRGCVALMPDAGGQGFIQKALGVAAPVGLGVTVYLGGAWLLGLRGYMKWKA